MVTSIKIHIKYVVLFALCLPLFSIFICVSLSIWYHWEESTATHCKVDNWLPTISSSVSRQPEAYVWRFGIGLHSAFRYLFAFLYYKFYKPVVSNLSMTFYRLLKLNLLTNYVESTCLLLLTCVSSIENYDIHKFSFIGFLGCSTTYMAITCFLFWRLGSLSHNNKNYRSFRMKITCLCCYLIFFLLSMYFFWSHNTYCEPGTYSLFALFEYLVVITNITFHGTAMFDFQDTVMEIPVHKIHDAGGKYDV